MLLDWFYFLKPLLRFAQKQRTSIYPVVAFLGHSLILNSFLFTCQIRDTLRKKKFLGNISHIIPFSCESVPYLICTIPSLEANYMNWLEVWDLSGTHLGPSLPSLVLAKSPVQQFLVLASVPIPSKSGPSLTKLVSFFKTCGVLFGSCGDLFWYIFGTFFLSLGCFWQFLVLLAYPAIESGWPALTQLVEAQ